MSNQQGLIEFNETYPTYTDGSNVQQQQQTFPHNQQIAMTHNQLVPYTAQSAQQEGESMSDVIGHVNTMMKDSASDKQLFFAWMERMMAEQNRHHHSTLQLMKEDHAGSRQLYKYMFDRCLDQRLGSDPPIPISSPSSSPSSTSRVNGKRRRPVLEVISDDDDTPPTPSQERVDTEQFESHLEDALQVGTEYVQRVRSPDGQSPDGQSPDGRSPDGRSPDGRSPAEKRRKPLHKAFSTMTKKDQWSYVKQFVDTASLDVKRLIDFIFTFGLSSVYGTVFAWPYIHQGPGTPHSGIRKGAMRCREFLLINVTVAAIVARATDMEVAPLVSGEFHVETIMNNVRKCLEPFMDIVDYCTSHLRVGATFPIDRPMTTDTDHLADDVIALPMDLAFGLGCYSLYEDPETYFDVAELPRLKTVAYCSNIFKMYLKGGSVPLFVPWDHNMSSELKTVRTTIRAYMKKFSSNKLKYCRDTIRCSHLYQLWKSMSDDTHLFTDLAVARYSTDEEE